MAGHRYNQGLGFFEAARRRGFEPVLLMNPAADAAVRAALPEGRPVFPDPVFRPDLSFDERTAAFLGLLHEHVSPLVQAGDQVFVTVATQVEGRALAAWLRELPEARRPWTLSLFLSDRWNREGADLAGQLAELRATAADFAAWGTAAEPRLVLASLTRGLSSELSGILGVPFGVAPMSELADGIEPSERPPHRPPRVAVLGGARREKGFHLLPEIVHACRRRGKADFVIQMHNEQLSAEEFSALCRLAGEPGVTGIPGALDRGPYLSCLQEADLVLFPYERIPYRQRTSGVLSEAILAGKPAVVPSGTWLAEQVMEGRAAGVIYEGEDAEAIAGAVLAALKDLAALSTAARERASRWKESQSLEPFLDWFEGEVVRRRNLFFATKLT